MTSVFAYVHVCVCVCVCVAQGIKEGGHLGLEMCRVRMRTRKVRTNRRHLSGNESEALMRADRKAVNAS